MKLKFVTINIGRVVLFIFISIFSSPIVQGQSGIKVECGTIIENEFTNNNEEHTYLLTMAARESFSVAVEPVGKHMQFYMNVVGPSGVRIYSHGWVKSLQYNSELLSARGIYSFKFTNGNLGIGLYTVSVGCVTANGTIEPGDILQLTPTPAVLPTATPPATLPDASSSFIGTGFPGLEPVDFSSVSEVPLLPDTPMTGVIPTSNVILGFTLDATAGDSLDLSYTRVSGNMNLGLVVLSENNEVFFQASLVTSESLSTRFTLPKAGQYTIGVFRINLVELEKVEPTVFQIKGTITAD